MCSRIDTLFQEPKHIDMENLAYLTIESSNLHPNVVSPEVKHGPVEEDTLPMTDAKPWLRYEVRIFALVVLCYQTG